MRLADYLAAREKQESIPEFSRRSGVPYRTVHNVASGGRCRVDTALAIIRATVEQPAPGGGTVALEDLVVERDGHQGAA